MRKYAAFLCLLISCCSAMAADSNVTVSVAGGSLITIRTKFTANTVDLTWIRATLPWGCNRAQWNAETNQAWSNQVGFPGGSGWRDVEGITQIILSPDRSENGKTPSAATTILIPATPQQLAAAFESAHIPSTIAPK